MKKRIKNQLNFIYITVYLTNRLVKREKGCHPQDKVF